MADTGGPWIKARFWLKLVCGVKFAKGKYPWQEQVWQRLDSFWLQERIASKEIGEDCGLCFLQLDCGKRGAIGVVKKEQQETEEFIAVLQTWRNAHM